MDTEQRNPYGHFQCQLEIQLLSPWHWRRENMQHSWKVWPVAKLQGLRLVILRLFTHHPFDSCSSSTIIKLFCGFCSWSHCYLFPCQLKSLPAAGTSNLQHCARLQLSISSASSHFTNPEVLPTLHAGRSPTLIAQQAELLNIDYQL